MKVLLENSQRLWGIRENKNKIFVLLFHEEVRLYLRTQFLRPNILLKFINIQNVIGE